MSRISTTFRSSHLLSIRGTRKLSSSHLVRAAAAPSSPSTTRYVRRATPSRAAPPKAPITPSGPAPVLDDFPEDFPIHNEIEDYSHLTPLTPRYPASPRTTTSASTLTSTPTPTPTPSPPLTSLPGEDYTPLPSAPAPASISSTTFASAPINASQNGIIGEATVGTDWSTSFAGLSDKPFDKDVAEALLRPLSPEDVEVKPDGLLYLPEIKYRRTLNAAFGPGGWGLAPRGETNVGPKIVSREWGLVCLGRLVAIARGEQEYFDPSGIATATEACKSNALMRCCKDLGIASELWDPRFIRQFKAKHCVEAFVEHAVTKKKRKLWRKKGDKFEYPYKEGV